MDKLLKLSIAAVLALSFTACGDDKDDKDEPAGCTNGAVQCATDGSKTIVCENGEWKDKATCSNGCDVSSNSCKADKPSETNTACKAGEDKDKCSESGSAVMTCNASGKWEIKDSCSAGCDTAKVECKAGSTPSKEGDTCDEKTFIETCEGQVVSYCNKGKVAKVSCAEAAEEYEDPSIVCAVIKGGYSDGADYADCFADDVACTTENKKETLCTEDMYGGYTNEFTCKKASNGKLYYLETGDEENAEDCQTGYCLDATKCEEPLVPDHGKECEPDTRKDKCDGTIYSTCYDPLAGTGFDGLFGYSVEAMDCAKDGMVCATSQASKEVSCVKTCDTADKAAYECDKEIGKEEGVQVLFTYTCQATTDGKKGEFQTGVKMCSTCDANGACNITDSDAGKGAKAGDECNEYLFAETCTDTKSLLYCDDGEVVAETCKTNETCVGIKDSTQVNCVDTTADKCDTVGATKKACQEEVINAKGDKAPIYLIFECVAADDGNNYWMVSDMDDICIDAEGKALACSDATGCAE